MRTRNYRRTVRKKAINRTKQKIYKYTWWAAEQSAESAPDDKIVAALYGDKPGLFAKHDYSAIGGYGAMKTKVKNIRTHPHRHKGWYGPAINRSRHDRKENDKLAQSIADYHDTDYNSTTDRPLRSMRNMFWNSSGREGQSPPL